MLSTCTKINHNEEIQTKALKLRQTRSIKIPDAIIAAIAITHNIPLLTADNEFTKISEIDTLFVSI